MGPDWEGNKRSIAWHKRARKEVSPDSVPPMPVDGTYASCRCQAWEVSPSPEEGFSLNDLSLNGGYFFVSVLNRPEV